MLKLLLSGIVLISCLALTTCLPPAEQDEPSNLPPAVQYEGPPPSATLNEKAVKFLKRFGYLRESNDNNLVSAEEAIRSMQAHAGLLQTGTLDEATMAKMESQRCSFPDVMTAEDKKKRYSVVSRWRNETLTYGIFNYPNCTIYTNDQIDAIIAEAVNEWVKIDPSLNITKFVSGTPKINISFVFFDHSDKYPFDGPGKVLGHCFYPGTGQMHFDNSECWGDGTNGTKNLKYVAIHELGHCLGLGHSNDSLAIMNAYYPSNNTQCKPAADDTAGIQSMHTTASP
ncbi:hypothetical protein HELRODRAFT_169282 [Helobdella robusta]|uniref:Peptidase metallopeptidase domain-containing protein n=1 Tax=Helobdella robusta TaxID=6412 RepID=T1F1Q1_HELRO|nr:hypothetical protein HELRODRAFT_169282 [Helobdella robusta]ESO08439.1 hypothetical protein HELRODRAFT_169282 [Helobdella robusta]